MDMLRFSDRFQAVLSLFSPQIGWIITVVKWVGMLRFIQMRNVKFSEKKLFKAHSKVRKPNELFPYIGILQTLLLLPCFHVATPSHYPDSDLYKLISCYKDTIYRFLKDGTIDWRTILYNITYQLWHRISIQNKIDQVEEKQKLPVVFIADDSDVEKTSYGTELVSMVFSHAQHKYIGCPVQCSEKLRLKSPVKLLIQHSDF